MLRFLPYLIVCLLVVIGGRLISFMDLKGDDDLATPVPEALAVESTEKNTDMVMNDVINALKRSEAEDKKKHSAMQSQTPITSIPEMKCISYVARDLSPTEIEILKGLKGRRGEIEQREQELLFKESTLQLTQEQIEERLNALLLLKEELKAIVKQYDEKESEKNTKLVRVYESMKPAHAAKIFEEIQLNVLLDVVEKMRETRLAPILASMDPVKAKELTVALVNRRKSIHISNQ